MVYVYNIHRCEATNKLQRAKGGCLGTGKPMKDAVSCEKPRGDANNL